jgi:zinc transport system substrate-binding protein
MPKMLIIIAFILSNSAESYSVEPIEVFVGIPPVAYLVERIGGDRVHVDVLLQPGQDPHTYEPSPKQIQALGRSKLFFRVGMPFENQLVEKIINMRLRLNIVDTAEGVKKIPFLPHASPEIVGQADSHSRVHSAEEYDPHVWLSPLLAKQLSGSIAAALCKTDPDGAIKYNSNLSKLNNELDDVDAKIRKTLEPFAGRTFYVFHPAFGYFADCYNLKQEAIEAEGKQPSPKQLRDLIQKAKGEKACVIFVQPQFDRHSAQAVADAIGGKIVPINDLEKNIISNLQDISEKIDKAYIK